MNKITLWTALATTVATVLAIYSYLVPPNAPSNLNVSGNTLSNSGQGNTIITGTQGDVEVRHFLVVNEVTKDESGDLRSVNLGRKAPASF